MSWNCSGTELSGLSFSRTMSSEGIELQPVHVQSARTSTFSPSQAAATENVSGSSIVVFTGPFANRALRASPIGARAPGSENVGAPSNVTSPVTSCLIFER